MNRFSRAVSVVAAVLLLGPVLGQDPKKVDDDLVPRRFMIDLNQVGYPQRTPKEAFTSIIKAVENERFDYLLAHLLEPSWIDKRIREFNLTPAKMAAEIRKKYTDDPELMKELRKFSIDGELTETADTAVIRLKGVRDRQIFMKKIGTRWFMENRRIEE
jgi:hypothetical protein